MSQKPEQQWDSMFLKPNQRASAFTLREPLEETQPHSTPPPDYISREPIFDGTLTFQENLEYIHDWTARALLGLIAADVPLHEVDFDYLERWLINFQTAPRDNASIL